MGAGLVVFKILFLVLIAHHSGWNRCLAGAHQLEEEEAAASAKLALLRAQQPAPPTDMVGDETAPEDRHQDSQETQNPSLEPHHQSQPVLSAGDAAPPAAAGGNDASQQVNQAELCYLSNGGSSLTLTVNEATQVGSIIGAVEVNGEPALEGGNVDLSDAAPEPPVASQPAGDEPARLRRILGKRWAGSDDIQAAANKTGRGPRMVAPPPPPPPLVGLVASEHSASFYSLLASQAAPVAQQAPQPPPVRLEPGTKNLILARPLDKEGAEGEQSLVIQVRCSPRAPPAESRPQAGGPGRAQPSRLEATTIPVRILVTDANDHAPQFVGAPYVVNISETAPVGSVASRDILALDRDSAGPFSTIHYRVLDDGQPHSALLHFANPLEPTLMVAGQLDYEQLAQFTLTLVAQDQGEPEPLSSSVQLQVNVVDFDDQNPRFVDDKYSLVMDESQRSLVGQNLQVLPRNLYAEDGDRGIRAPILYAFDQQQQQQQPQPQPAHDEPAAQPIEHYLHLEPSSGEIRLIRQWPGGWLGPPMTLVVRATQADNRDRYTLTTLTILPGVGAAPPPPRPARWPSDQGNNPGKGIEFSPDRLNVSVLESVAINEKIARVRARYLPASGAAEEATTQAPGSQEGPVDLVAQATTGGPGDHGAGRAPRRTSSNQDDGKRPINYQILGDQADQFGINGLGDIFVKRPLDYEQRQQHRFRVLATYTKYSDVCQVQVNVINVNDNKPKFTQPQYSFHVGESRLRSNQIGLVQAHDADLNDSVRYSLLGEHAHLFDISPGGLISLRPSTRQLDLAACQLVAQASDTLAPPLHSHQARVQLQVAPHLVGRPLGHLLLAAHSPPPPPPDDPSSRLFNSRSLLQQRENRQRLHQGPSEDLAPYQQRSSVATVVSSLQHMVRSVSIFDMPVSSALLLAALLAFLVCLLFIVLVSMSVHLYRRRHKQRQRHQMAAAASRLRHAHLAAALQPAPAGGSRYHLTGSNSNSNSNSNSGSSSDLSPRGQPAPGSSASGSPTTTTSGGGGGEPRAKQPQAARLAELASATGELKLRLAGEQPSLISSLASSQSKSSYTTDDSSVMHCGHYSVNSSSRLSLASQQPPRPLADRESRPDGGGREQQQQPQDMLRAKLAQHQQMVAAAASVAATTKLRPNELSVLTAGQPGIKAYRKLPQGLGSLVRPRGNRVSPGEAAEDSAASGDGQVRRASNNSDSAIASDVSSSSQPPQVGGPPSGALMTLIRSPERARPALSQFPVGAAAVQPDEGLLSPAGDIRWPRNAMPHRVKKLTWDDGGEQEDEDCFVAPEIQLAGPISPLSNHQYPIQGTAGNEDHYAEQHFLFSNPCSPSQQLHSSSSDFAGHSATSFGQQHRQENCFDYTIVQSSQFRVDSLQHQHLHQQSLSAQHHLLQQQQQQQQQQEQRQRPASSYLYSNTGGAGKPAAANQEDLKLMTTAVL